MRAARRQPGGRIARAIMLHQALSDPDDDILQALEMRRANLDQRLHSGEIDRPTHARYLQAYKLQLIDSLGYGRPRWPERILAALLAPWLEKRK